ncbi:MAG: ABC transporter ATP-binding protein [Gemmatimonadales bacterium]
MSDVLVASGVVKSYQGGDGSAVEVLRGLDLTVESGEFVAIVGASGSGKSTLLHLLGALDVPSTGEIALEGRSYGGLDPASLALLRNRRIGFVFQFHHLLRDFSARENVMMPQLIGGESEAAAAARADELLAAFGLANRASHMPAQLSGGEQQRVAVARALARAPALLLADEPSGNLDPENAEILHEVLSEVRARYGTALVVATHNRALAERADRILRLAAGVLVAEGYGEEAIPT